LSAADRSAVRWLSPRIIVARSADPLLVENQLQVSSYCIQPRWDAVVMREPITMSGYASQEIV
jgi:hypothetical protein